MQKETVSQSVSHSANIYFLIHSLPQNSKIIINRTKCNIYQLQILIANQYPESQNMQTYMLLDQQLNTIHIHYTFDI